MGEVPVSYGAVKVPQGDATVADLGKKRPGGPWWCHFLLIMFALLWCRTCLAHVGSPDVYAEGAAGPYKLFVTVRPALVVPGVAELEVRSADPGITSIQAAPMPLVGEAANRPPVPDTLVRSATDQQFYTGSLWIMASGSWQIRFSVNGLQGAGVLSIPVPATASSNLGMTRGLGLLLALLCLLLVAGLIGIVGAAVRAARIAPGAPVPESRAQPARAAMAIALVLIAAALFFANRWWNLEATVYAKNVYKPLAMRALLTDDGTALNLKLTDPGWLKTRVTTDFIPDHDHLMHLYLLRTPAMDVIYHLHPQQLSASEYKLPLPSLPAGRYTLYADVVHATGFPETLVTTVDLPEIEGRALSGDDAKGLANSLPANNSGTSVRLPDGYTMIWDRPAAVRAKQAAKFSFRLLDPSGNAPTDMAPYMGMAGHAAFVKTDGTVFAHLHPSGTASMAAMTIASVENGASQVMPMVPVGNTVSFPYGFPSAGNYRLFIQMKHGQTVETAAFDTAVAP